jgi:hypothetical protein
MKRNMLFAAMLISLFTMAQVPQLINYQTVVRNSAGSPVPNNTPVKLQLLIHDITATGAVVYTETSGNLLTNQFGLVNYAIGQNANLSTVNWSTGNKWLQVKADIGNTGTYTDMGTSMFNAVPYALYSGSSSIPSGSIMPFAGDSAHIPSGWLLCDGREVSRTVYSALFATIGINWGVGDGINTFNLPDTRGMFLRGVSYGSGNDPDANISSNGGNDGLRYAKYLGGNAGNKVGSYQIDTFKVHKHIWSNGTYFLTEGVATSRVYRNSGLAWNDASTETPASGGNETRPKNVYVNYIIKE